ncbi:hypothetical protein Hanom_Chr05g00442101 [Helianthus anomalus]
MSNKSNLTASFNILTQLGLNWLVEKYHVPSSLNPVLLLENDTPIYPLKSGKISVYTRVFYYYNYRLPFTRFLIDALMFHQTHLSQMNPFWKKNATCFSCITTSMKDSKDRFFLLDDRCVPAEMTWRLRSSNFPGPLPEGFVYVKTLYASLIKEAGRIQKLPEHILVMGKISTIWPEPDYYPTIHWNGVGLSKLLNNRGSLDDRVKIGLKNVCSILAQFVNEPLGSVRFENEPSMSKGPLPRQSMGFARIIFIK